MFVWLSLLADAGGGDRRLRGGVGVLRRRVQGPDPGQPEAGRRRRGRGQPAVDRGLAGLRPALRVRHRHRPGCGTPRTSRGWNGRCSTCARNFWAGETFVDLADAQARAGAWCTRTGRERIHGTHPGPPARGVHRARAPPCCCRSPAAYDVPMFNAVQGAPRLPRRDRPRRCTRCRRATSGSISTSGPTPAGEAVPPRHSWSRSIPGSRPAAGGPTRDDLPGEQGRLRDAGPGPARSPLRRARARTSASTPSGCSTTRCPGPGCGRSTGCSAWSAATAPTRSNTACGTALELDVVSVTKIASMLERATENTAPTLPSGRRHRAARFARDPGEYAAPATPSLDRSGHRGDRPATAARTSVHDGDHPMATMADRDRPGRRRPARRCSHAQAAASCTTPCPNGSPWPASTNCSHADFLELVLADEVTRRDTHSAALRAGRRPRPGHAPGHLGHHRRPALRPHPVGRPDHAAVPRRRPPALILGPGRGRQDAPGHRARPHRRPPPAHRAMARADKLFTRLRAARLDNTLDAEMRRLAHVELLIIDDFALRPLGRHRDRRLLRARRRTPPQSTPPSWTSNREPDEWLTMTTDPLLAQSAVDRLTSTAHTLIVEGPSYRQRTRAQSLTQTQERSHDHQQRQVVPSSWQPGGPITVASDRYEDRRPNRSRSRKIELRSRSRRSRASVRASTMTETPHRVASAASAIWQAASALPRVSISRPRTGHVTQPAGDRDASEHQIAILIVRRRQCGQPAIAVGGRLWVLPQLDQTHAKFKGDEGAREPASRFRSSHEGRLGLLGPVWPARGLAGGGLLRRPTSRWVRRRTGGRVDQPASGTPCEGRRAAEPRHPASPSDLGSWHPQRQCARFRVCGGNLVRRTATGPAYGYTVHR